MGACSDKRVTYCVFTCGLRRLTWAETFLFLSVFCIVKGPFYLMIQLIVKTESRRRCAREPMAFRSM